MRGTSLIENDIEQRRVEWREGMTEGGREEQNVTTRKYVLTLIHLDLLRFTYSGK